MSFAGRAAMLPVKFYRRFISKPLHFCLGPWCGCRFAPTCSEYALQALAKHGFFKGTWLALTRLVRCNPFSAGGIDEVPE